jgi:hypothetical protein
MEPWPLTAGWHGLNRVEPGIRQGCLFCKIKETVINVFSVCTRLMPLMSLLECLCERLGVGVYCWDVYNGIQVFE